MGTSILLAQLLGPYLMIVAIGVWLNLEDYQKVIKDFMQNAALVYLGGIIALLFGLLIVLFHNVWACSWALIITIMGWAGIIKGILLIVFPKTILKISEVYFKKTLALRIHIGIIFVLGLVLVVVGYFA